MSDTTAKLQTEQPQMTTPWWKDPAFDPIRTALVARMQTLNYENATTERANWMMGRWDKFTDRDVQENYREWMDPKIIELLFDALSLHDQ
jgi:hypothetical protein